MVKRTGFLFVVRFLNKGLLSKYTPPSSIAERSAVGKIHYSTKLYANG